jgi:type II secretory pathway pseudopilin PulG
MDSSRCDTLNRPRPPRRAFTLTETVTVIVIALLGLTLLLPALVLTRQQAREVQQEERFRDLGQSVRNHHDTHGRFPAGGMRAPREK